MTKKAEVANAEPACAWESGELGNSAEHAVPASREHGAAVDEALGLQMISIRLPKALISDLKLIADKEGLGYQPLIRRVLMRFAEAEFRNMAHQKLLPTLEGFGRTGRDFGDCGEEEDLPLRRAVG